MHMRGATVLVVLVVGALAVAGCATPGASKDQVTSTIFSTHSSVKKLEDSLGKSVEQLNTTAADLTARVDESDRQTRLLRSLAEENQVKLDQLQAKLDQLTATLYRYLNLTPSTSMSGGYPSPSSHSVTVGAPPAPRAPAPGGEARPIEPLEPGAAPGAQLEVAPGPLSPVAAYQEAQKSFINQDYEASLAQYREYSRRYPDTDYAGNAQFWQGECYYRLEKYEEAIQEFDKLRANFPTSSKVPIAINNQAAAHLRLGQTTRAVELLQELVENYPMAPAAARAKTKLQELGGDAP